MEECVYYVLRIGFPFLWPAIYYITVISFGLRILVFARYGGMVVAKQVGMYSN